jgi:hypothetical protein
LCQTYSLALMAIPRLLHRQSNTAVVMLPGPKSVVAGGTWM